MTLKQLIQLNGADPNQYTPQELKQIRWLVTSKKLNPYFAHKQAVEKYGFQCQADRPCAHKAPNTFKEDLKAVEKLHEIIYGNL